MNCLTSFHIAGAASFFTAASRLLVFCLLAGHVQAAVYYVKQDATGANNGTSWTDAYNDLQDAIDAASPGDQLWVAGGAYKPAVAHGGATDRYKTFYINKNIEIYGGFNGTETLLPQRNLQANPTILSGDIGAAGVTSDNAYHVVRIRQVGNAMRLDGFTITGGNANGTYVTHPANVHLGSNNSISLFGGGMLNLGGGSSNSYPTIANCTFFGNSAHAGGGIYNFGVALVPPSLTLTNCLFHSNGAGLPKPSASPSPATPTATPTASATPPFPKVSATPVAQAM